MPPKLGPEHRTVPKSTDASWPPYGRNLFHRDPTGFVVIAMVWPPGVGGGPHDHGTWGVVGVLEGNVRVTDFERQDDGSDPDRADLLELDSGIAGPGAVADVLPPHRDFHAVGNASEDEWALTLHTYGRDICRCRSVDLETGLVRVVETHYTNGRG